MGAFKGAGREIDKAAEISNSQGILILLEFKTSLFIKLTALSEVENSTQAYNSRLYHNYQKTTEALILTPNCVWMTVHM